MKLSISCALSQDSSGMLFAPEKIENIDQISEHLAGDYNEMRSLGILLTSKAQDNTSKASP